MDKLYATSNKLIKSTITDFRRSLYSEINWQQRLIEIKGSRGVGKTTLMLQKANEIYKENPQKVIYVTLDDAYFYNHSLIETAEQFNKYGGEIMFVDEVHKYPAKQKSYDWSSELKNIYDLYPELSVIYSGSSIIEIYKGNGDLSRRKSTYNLNGLSFREYLELNGILTYGNVTLSEIIQNGINISNDITSQIKILPHFKTYLKQGYYPFYNEAPEQYYQRIKNIVNVILEVDIPSITEITFETIGKIKKMLAILSSTVPYTPNLTKLSKDLNIADLRTLYKYFYYLETAELIGLLQTENRGNKIFHKPEKILLNNSNISNAIFGDYIDIGTVRETFFYNQVNYLHTVNYPKYGDFIVDNKYIFEVGGKNKSTHQIKDIEHFYLVLDEMEIGFANKIPLWLFGFLY